MPTFLFDKIIFGPVRSRRLGSSLGINLLPADKKMCSFNCVYCECGLNTTYKSNAGMPVRYEVYSLLEEKLKGMVNSGQKLDIITFAGNGEPTLHPDFAGIIDDTIELRNRFMSQARIAVLSNAYHLNKKDVREALLKVDDNILKLDSGLSESIITMDRPAGHFDLDNVVNHLKWFQGRLIIQTMFVKGRVDDLEIDNTGEKDILPWLEILKEVKPSKVMIYTIERDTPFESLEKVDVDALQAIALRVESIGVSVQVSG